MQFADHYVECAEIPYRGKTLPAVFHLPPGYQNKTKVPVVVLVPGMDGYKEKYVSLYGDGFMERRVAALVVEGPGYWESPLRGIFIDVAGCAETGRETVRWLLARPEIDADKIGITGSSFGSFFSAVMMANEPRFQACAITGTCYEPGGYTIFETASPTFKRRFMLMCGITNESEFDRFRKSLDWHGYAEKVRAPYLVAVGAADELCPIEYAEQFVHALAARKQLVIDEDARHGVGGVPSTVNGPEPRTYQAEWIMAGLAGRPFASERWFVEASGKIDTSAL
ncbi:MAG TPA: prolyl oligopeptidase family serine peptidase [Xanthobacteraceae bacterium]|jgi:dienelactone hydrolase